MRLRHLVRLLRVRGARRTAAFVTLIAAGLCTIQSGCRAEQPWPLWERYTARFLEGSGRVIDRSSGDRTTSEGQAYAMFFALVVNDRKTFDKLLRWTEDNLAGGDLTARLPAWSWGKTSTGEWKQLDTNSASDADLWLAYDCLEAGRLWKDDRLLKLGTVMAERVSHSEVVLVPSVGAVLLPGPQGFHPSTAAYVLNPSYTPPQVLARIRQEVPNGPWASLQQSLPALLGHGAPAGFAADWISAGPVIVPSPSPTVLAQGKQDPGPSLGSYDAIRVYLWLGMADRGTPGVREGLAALPGMANYLSGNVTPPLLVESTGKIDNPDGTIGFSAAAYPYLIALGKKTEAKAQMDRVEASLDATTGLYGHGGEYYDQNLALFATGWNEQRFRFERDGKLKLKWK